MSGIDPETGEWSPAFPGQRPPHTSESLRGNSLGLRHGAYATLHLAPRAAEIATYLRDVAPVYHESQSIAYESAGMIGARFEVAITALIEADDPTAVEILDLRAHRWAKLWASWLDRLGLTPLAAAKLGLDLTRTRGEALRAHLAEHYGSGE